MIVGWITGPEGECPTRHPSPRPSFHSASLQKRVSRQSGAGDQRALGLPSPPRTGCRSPCSVSDQYPALPSNLSGVLLCSGGLSHVTILHMALHLTQLLPDLEQGGWICVEAWLDARSSSGGPQALSAAMAPQGTCSDERGLCGLPCRFLGGRRPAPRPFARVKLQLRDPDWPCAHSPLTARPVAWSPATPRGCGTCETGVQSKGGDLPGHTVVPAATGPGSSKRASSPSSSPPTSPLTGRGNMHTQPPQSKQSHHGHSPGQARHFVSGLHFWLHPAETEILIRAASTEKTEPGGGRKEETTSSCEHLSGNPIHAGTRPGNLQGRAGGGSLRQFLLFLRLGKHGVQDMASPRPSQVMTPWNVAHQVPPLSMGFSRQEYWSKLPCPLPGDLPNPGDRKSVG